MRAGDGGPPVNRASNGGIRGRVVLNPANQQPSDATMGRPTAAAATTTTTRPRRLGASRRRHGSCVALALLCLAVYATREHFEKALLGSSFSSVTTTTTSPTAAESPVRSAAASESEKAKTKKDTLPSSDTTDGSVEDASDSQTRKEKEKEEKKDDTNDNDDNNDDNDNDNDNDNGNDNDDKKEATAEPESKVEANTAETLSSPHGSATTASPSQAPVASPPSPPSREATPPPLPAPPPWEEVQADAEKFRDIYHAIDSDMERTDRGILERCHRYGYDDKVLVKKGVPQQEVVTHNRRIFMGSLIADDSWEVLRALATESYGLYEAIVFVESNATQMKTPRAWRFPEDSEEHALLTQSGMFGPNTTVVVKYFIDETDSEIPPGLVREQFQRERIVEGWKELGMRKDDVGLLSDTDEVFTRDFLWAAKQCNAIRQFHPASDQHDCLRPKIMGTTLVFEASPECVTVGRRWFHPDMILGACITGIGNETGRVELRRQWKNRGGKRAKGYGGGPTASWSAIPKAPDNRYPLWNGGDFRQSQGGQFAVLRGSYPTLRHLLRNSTPSDKDANVVDVLPQDNRGHSAFHFHNFFHDLESLRHKYRTYAHPVRGAASAPFMGMNPDMTMAVKCLRKLPQRFDEEDGRQYDPGGFPAIVGPRPIYFTNVATRQARHAEAVALLQQDEAKYGHSSLSPPPHAEPAPAKQD